MAFWLARVSNPPSVIARAVAYGMCVCRTQCGIGARAMGAEVDREGRHVELALARQPLAAEADREQIARAHLRPVRAVRIEQEAVVAAGDDQAEVVVDALVEAVERGGAERGRELDAGHAEPGGSGAIRAMQTPRHRTRRGLLQDSGRAPAGATRAGDAHAL